MLRPWLILPLCLLLAACAHQAPTVPEPEPAPAQFKESEAQNPGQPDAAGAKVPPAWWQLFQDPVLDALEQRVAISNENLKASLAQLASARATLSGSQSATEPTLGVNLSGSRSASANSSSDSGTPPVNSVSLGATASWELDLWGRLSLATQGAQATVRAAEADLAAIRLSAQATLAQTYFALRSAEVQQSLLKRSVEAYQRALDLTQARYDAGVAPQTDVLQANTQLSTARTQLADVAAQRAQYEHAIAVLAGQAPSTFSLDATAQLPANLKVPDSLPADLLQRRPDIAASQQRVRAAYAQIGVTDAAFFPSLTLSASAGYAQSSLANLISAPNLFWSLGASVGQTIFDGGSRQLASDQARANADQVSANYRQLVLTALQEVEDNLVLAKRLDEELQSQTSATQSSDRTLQLVLEQYRAGTVSYLNVTSAQGTALASEINLLAIRTRQLNATNTLLKNIAGSWDNN